LQRLGENLAQRYYAVFLVARRAQPGRGMAKKNNNIYGTKLAETIKVNGAGLRVRKLKARMQCGQYFFFF